jgi:16S rRNA (uracil1498-N3)-methyltransferase
MLSPNDNRGMDLYRFHIPDLRAQLQSGPVAALSPDQAHHARSVLRLSAGDAVILFDGRGAWVRAALQTLHKSTAAALADGPIHIDPPPSLHLTLATAVPKGERADWLIEQSSQLNVAAVQWLDCDRGVVKPREGGGKMEKWRRLAIESAKQCGRTHVMEIREMAGLKEVLAGAADAMTLWLEPGAQGKRAGEALANRRAGKVLALIGPEGGWSAEERALLEKAANEGRITRVRLTETVLRIETACAAVAAVVRAG